MIQEDPRRKFFLSPPILEKLAPDRRARRDDSNGVRFTSNGLRMRKLSRSVVLMKQEIWQNGVPRGTMDKVTHGIHTVRTNHKVTHGSTDPSWHTADWAYGW